ncbi:similar to Saccharomyces cerevisiae YGR279C SCW4 Cell wall protein with similarity to glucanases [Maudiozyma barnettii]|uniref:Similar to Saccharomyces cerevisiae YGR279C SCW4 Cell wall protein with similarity to glucanases n=1 Tax=Maudiozyma barnettii TaxID=61262 RepID=A0A8H2VIS9_9SACH|nr:putative family 17 glucosidase [Kazachstania barnettii]CAB4256150.1 similar to Saccharomyces cerevisiae YGR279C SCW4 Cell wall protein with similarity to glucanases [Kazachstania barnettii]CAD1784758.1 similar to Saccharomyces cerevisiae YGR279C SCW4 Cell wall protein with similarity to glucanases [Kazachstania barnettii]
MRFSTLLATASLVGAAAAAPAVHNHNEKRDVVTTTIQAEATVYVDGNGNPIETQQAVAAVAQEKALVSAVQADALEGAATTPVAAAATAKAATTKATSAVTQATSAASSSSNTGAAGVKGVTYSPYNADGSCKSASQVSSDLAQLSGYPTIRLYGVDCNQVANVLQGKSASQDVFLGIFDVNQIQSAVDTMKAAIDQYGSWDEVVSVSVGNELVNGGQATPAQVGQYIDTGRAALQAAGYNGPVVSVDTFIAVINNPELCKYSDYMAVNAHAFFDKNTVASDSGSWLLQQIQRVWTACDGAKDVVITESGWPSQGQTYGVAVPSKDNQKAAVSAITSSCGDSTYLFTAFNDLWKADGEYGVEKWFGVHSDE